MRQCLLGGRDLPGKARDHTCIDGIRTTATNCPHEIRYAGSATFANINKLEFRNIVKFIHQNLYRLRRKWEVFWMRRSSLTSRGRLAMNIASLFSRQYKARCYLASFGENGYVAPSAIVEHSALRSTRDVYIGDRSTVYQCVDGGSVTLHSGVHLYSDVIMETGQNGCIEIGEGTHIQARCVLCAYRGSIRIGRRVEIAPHCALYPYNHQINPGEIIRNQMLVSKGNISIDDDVWLGFGSIVLDGVHIGTGAVVGAGAVVKQNVPACGIAVGVPAKVIGYRTQTQGNE